MAQARLRMVSGVGEEVYANMIQSAHEKVAIFPIQYAMVAMWMHPRSSNSKRNLSSKGKARTRTNLGMPLTIAMPAVSVMAVCLEIMAVQRLLEKIS